MNELFTEKLYLSLHNLAPTYLSTKFTYTSDIDQVNLSSLTDSTLYVPKPDLEIYRKTFAYSGSKILNTLPESVRDPKPLVIQTELLRWKKKQLRREILNTKSKFC